MASIKKEPNIPKTPWTEARLALYQALEVFSHACGNVLGVGHILEDKDAPNSFKGSLLPKAEDAFRSLLRSYAKEHNIGVKTLLEQLKVLGAYIKNRQPFQLQKRNLSLQELCKHKDWFEQWMEAAHAWKQEIKIVREEKRPTYRKPPILTPEEEKIIRERLEMLKTAAGRQKLREETTV